MERGIKDEILDIIEDIEEKNTEIETYISNLKLLSREETLKAIMKNVIEKNRILQEIENSKGYHLHNGVNEQVNKWHDLVENFFSKIKESPTKKIIYLREFLANFPSISNNDKDVIINSLKDENNEDNLKEKMMSLVDIFLQT